MIEIVEYETEDGKNHYKKWFKSLPSEHARKVVTAIRRMEAGNLGDSKHLSEGLYEHRIHNPAALRIYFGKKGKELVILLAGGGKAHQGRDIARAKTLWQEYKKNK